MPRCAPTTGRVRVKKLLIPALSGRFQHRRFLGRQGTGKSGPYSGVQLRWGAICADDRAKSCERVMVRDWRMRFAPDDGEPCLRQLGCAAQRELAGFT